MMTHKMGLVKLSIETSRSVYESLTESNSSSTTINRNFTGSATIGASVDFNTYKPCLSGTSNKTVTRINSTTASAVDSYYFYIIKPGNTITFNTNYSTNMVGWKITTSSANENECQFVSVTTERDFKNYTGKFTFVGSNCLSSSPLTWSVPGKGIYIAELWGAEGGARLASASVYGGRGGYVKASKELNSSITAYLYIGGSGILDSQSGQGGWNGGGNSGTRPWSAGGGGGTDIRIGGTGNGYSTTTDNRVLVAGGGGGASGGNESYDYLDGGSPNAGGGSYKFQGDNGPANHDGGGGGGGYQGGHYGTDGSYVARGGTNYVSTADGWTLITSGRQTSVLGNGKINITSTL